eukprot:jgi/Hompol1/6094/HPOL_000354-RA
MHEKLSKAASMRHHLLGTKAVPGVYARVQTAKAVRQPDVIDEHGHVDPFAKIPESKLRHNPGIDAWIRDNIGKNPKNIRIHPPETPELEPDEQAKLVQGPFLPKYRLYRKKLMPLHPTLRVETDFYDTRSFAREERRKDIALRVSQQPFATGLPSHKPTATYFLRDEPYVPKDNGMFRKYDPTQRISKKEFKNVLAPIRLFDEVLQQ